MSNTKKIELRLCPFCGGRASVILDSDGAYYNVGCNDDLCIGEMIACVYYKHPGDLDDVVKQWNTRKQLADNSEEVEK